MTIRAIARSETMKNLDMIGKACPLPVIEAKKALSDSGEDGVAVAVDNEVAVNNLTKLANSLGYTAQHVQNSEKEFVVTISKGDDFVAVASEKCEECAITSDDVFLIGSNKMGVGEEELGEILMKGFIFSVSALDVPPKAILFVNSGVKLCIEGMNTIDDLTTLVEKGTTVLACGNCLNYYGLTEKIAVGEITDMYNITKTISDAKKVINL